LTEQSRRLGIDLGGLIEVFGGHLYSSPEVFVRELLQNGFDAIAERKRAEPSFMGILTVRADESNRTLEFQDNGIGVTEDGLARHLGTIAHSSKRDAQGRAFADLIGRFGIGLISGFLVADEIRVETRASGHPGFRWTGRRDGTYSVEAADGLDTGSRVTLPLRPTARAYAQPGVLKTLLERYGAYLPVRLTLSDGSSEELISRPAPWDTVDAAKWKEWLDTRRADATLFIPLKSGSARGFAWVCPREVHYGGARCDVYIRGMLVREATADLLPEWAGFASAVIEAPDLSPTASREDIVRDASFQALRESIKKQLLHWLETLPRRDSAAFERFLGIHHLYVKGACLDSEPLMAVLAERLPFETNQGWMRLGDHLRALSTPVIRFVRSLQEFAHLAPLATAQRMTVVNACYTYDEPFLKAYGQRYGFQLEPLSAGSLNMFVKPAPEEAPRYEELLAASRGLFSACAVDIEIGRFVPTTMPAFLIDDPHHLRGRAEALAASAKSDQVRSLLTRLSGIIGDRARLVLNLDNELISALADLCPADQGARVIRLLYVLSALQSGRTLTPGERSMFNEDVQFLVLKAIPWAGLRAN
jgi:molecular chaperone HtpG